MSTTGSAIPMFYITDLTFNHFRFCNQLEGEKSHTDPSIRVWCSSQLSSGHLGWNSDVRPCHRHFPKCSRESRWQLWLSCRCWGNGNGGSPRSIPGAAAHVQLTTHMVCPFQLTKNVPPPSLQDKLWRWTFTLYLVSEPLLGRVTSQIISVDRCICPGFGRDLPGKRDWQSVASNRELTYQPAPASGGGLCPPLL